MEAATARAAAVAAKSLVAPQRRVYSVAESVTVPLRAVQSASAQHPIMVALSRVAVPQVVPVAHSIVAASKVSFDESHAPTSWVTPWFYHQSQSAETSPAQADVNLPVVP